MGNYGVYKGMSIYDDNFNKVDVIIVNNDPNNLTLDSGIGSIALESDNGKIWRKDISSWKEISSFDSLNIFDFKSSVIAATTETDGNINLSNYTGTIDGVTLVNNGRYLIKNQTDKTKNGIYVYNSTNSSFTRSSDADENSEVTGGMIVPVSDGNVNRNILFMIANADPITIGTTEIEFVSIGVYKAGNGININGNIIEVLLNNNSGLQFVSGKLAVKNNSSSIVINTNGELEVRNYKKFNGVYIGSGYVLVDSLSVTNGVTVRWYVTISKSNAIYSSIVNASYVNGEIGYNVSSVLKVNINNFTNKPSISVSVNGSAIELKIKADNNDIYNITRDVNE